MLFPSILEDYTQQKLWPLVDGCSVGFVSFCAFYPLFILLPWFLTHFPFPTLTKTEDNFSKVGGIFYFVEESNIIILSLWLWVSAITCDFFESYWPKWWESFFISVRVTVFKKSHNLLFFSMLLIFLWFILLIGQCIPRCCLQPNSYDYWKRGWVRWRNVSKICNM